MTADTAPMGWTQIAEGGVNTGAGNSVKHFTGSFRRGEKPRFHEATCIHCLFCWVFCPDRAVILTEGEKVAGINYDYCKGCGICVNECPVKNDPAPLEMIKDNKEL